MGAAPTRGWCGRCGRDFDLAEVLEPGAAGRCPRCLEPFAPSYDALLIALLRGVLAGASDERALADLASIAPALHVEGGEDAR